MAGVVDGWARESLRGLEAKHLRRFLEPLESPQGPRVRVDGRVLLNFSSNDYLGLANAPLVVEAGRAALLRHGAGSGASRLVVGDFRPHRSLEVALARFEEAEAALLFGSGYAANVGALTALLGRDDVVFSDAWNHASLIDGCRLSRARVAVYPHGDLAALDALLAVTPGRRRLVATDAVFSMDGDVAPLAGLRALCDRHGAALLVDEAHATGVLGARGAGLCEATGVRPDVLVGTLSKALGGFGGYVCGSAALREALLNLARPLVFSTSLPPATCAAAEVALALLEAPERRELGDAERALAASATLRERGLLVKAIRPPTVPEGTSRLRVAVTAAHSPEDVEALLAGLVACGVGRAPPAPALLEQRAR